MKNNHNNRKYETFEQVISLIFIIMHDTMTVSIGCFVNGAYAFESVDTKENS